jgi:hypothetical protein
MGMYQASTGDHPMANVSVVFAPKAAAAKPTFNDIEPGNFFEFKGALFYKINSVNALKIVDNHAVGVILYNVGGNERQNPEKIIFTTPVDVAAAGVGFAVQQHEDKILGKSAPVAKVTGQKRGQGGRFA